MDIAAVDRFLQARAGADLFSGVVCVERSRDLLVERGYGPASRAYAVQDGRLLGAEPTPAILRPRAHYRELHGAWKPVEFSETALLAGD